MSLGYERRMEREDLPPCPLCRAEKIILTEYLSGETILWEIDCSNADQCTNRLRGYASMEEAIAAWKGCRPNDLENAEKIFAIYRDGSDVESAHIQADNILLLLLDELGYKITTQAYRSLQGYFGYYP